MSLPYPKPPTPTSTPAGVQVINPNTPHPQPPSLAIGQMVIDPKTGTPSIAVSSPNGVVLKSLQGPMGMTGAMGMQGPMGPPGMRGQTVFQGTKSQVTVDEIIDFMDVMKQRLLVLTPMFELHEKYPALKQAYDDYLLIEKLVSGDQPDEQ